MNENMKITTVNGDILPQNLGFTSMHDHTFIDMKIAGAFMKRIFHDIPEQMLEFRPENYGFLKTGIYLMSPQLQEIDDMEFLLHEYGYFSQAGGRSVVDPAPAGIRGNVQQLQKLSRRSGLQILCATGIYTATSRPDYLKGRSEEELYEFFRKEITNGIDGTDVHPGLLKCAVATYGPNGIMQEEMDGIRACSRLSAETGLAVYLHTDPQVRGEDLLKIVKMMIRECGADPHKIEVCHMDNRLACGVSVNDYIQKESTARNISLETHRRLLDLGVNLGLDTWGMPVHSTQMFFTDDFDRMKALITLVREGYDGQLTLGNDFSSKIAGRTYGEAGCTAFISQGIAALKENGMEKAITQITINNPARILAY